MASSRTTSAPALALVIAAKAVSISWGERASRLCSRNRNVRAASSASRNWDALLGLAGFHRTATRDTSGSTSLSTSNCFPIRSGAIIDTPVTFPWGRARLDTSPAPKGSITTDMMIGIVLVACWATWLARPPTATMTCTFRRTRSAARAGYRSYVPSAHRDSIAML